MLGRAREHFEPAKRYLGQRLGRLGIPPWLITLSGLALALLASLLYFRVGAWAAALVAGLAALADFVDGAVARYQQRQSPWGNYLEAIVDRLVELVLLLTLAPDLGPVVAWAIAASMFISYCKPRVALVIQADNHDWPGLGDHADRMVILLLSIALCQVSLRLGQLGIGLLALMAGVGSLQRLRYAHTLISNSTAALNNTSERTPPPPK